MVVVVDVQKDKKHKKHKDSVEDEGVDSAAPATPAAASAAPSAMSPDDAAVKIQSQARRLEAKKKVEKVKQDKSKKAESAEASEDESSKDKVSSVKYVTPWLVSESVVWSLNNHMLHDRLARRTRRTRARSTSPERSLVTTRPSRR